MNINDKAKAPFWSEYPERDTEYIRFYPLKHSNIAREDIFSKKNMGFYVHIPFCKNVCMSCPYHKTKPTEARVDKYIHALKKEIENYGSRPYVKNHLFTSGYIGGGTPTTMSVRQMEELFECIHANYNLSDSIEITVETTPVDITPEKLDVLMKYGVDRISLGAQSFIDEELKNIGRNYNSQKIIDTIEMIHSKGIKKLNIDLMYGMPGQTMESWGKTIDIAVELGVSGVSLYNFMLMENPKNVIRVMKNEIPPMPNDEVRTEQFYYAADKLTKYGFIGLFGDEFSKPGFKNAYVTKPWEELLEYIAVGAWAMGNVKNNWYFNETNIGKYEEIVERGELPIQIGAKITPKDQMRRKMILGVKTGKVNRQDYYDTLGVDFVELFADEIKQLEENRLVELTETDLEVKGPKGWYYLDNISKTFFEEEFRRYPQPVQNEVVRYYKN